MKRFIAEGLRFFVMRFLLDMMLVVIAQTSATCTCSIVSSVTFGTAIYGRRPGSHYEPNSHIRMVVVLVLMTHS